MIPLGACSSVKSIQVLVLLSGSIPALCQSITFSAASTACPAHSSSTALPIPKLDPDYSEYTFTYPPSLSNRRQDIKLSYKDTINVTWTSVSPHHNASLFVACWNRNKTNSSTCTLTSSPALPTCLNYAPLFITCHHRPSSVWHLLALSMTALQCV